MDKISIIFEILASFVWNYFAVIFCLIAAVYFSFTTKLVQFRMFPHAIDLILGKFDKREETGHISHFQALCAALSGTVGIGNISGVAIAISIGGPGAVFWMWIVAILGMASKYAECCLSTYYRESSPSGEVKGGPMYYIKNGLPKKWHSLSYIYSFLIIFASLGFTCMFQTNQAAKGFELNYNISPWITGSLISILIFVVIIGGINRIGQVASKIIPFMCGTYLLGALYIIAINITSFFDILYLIIYDGLTGKAVFGGTLGSTFLWGVRRAVFSNEAGLGSASIAHAAVKTNYPVREGIVASLEPFIDTIVVCGATAFVILLSGNYGLQRFVPAVKTNFSFEDTRNFEKNKGWEITNKNIPPESDKIRTYIEGNNVLQYKGKEDHHESMKVKNIPVVSDGWRFSYFRKQGDMDLKIISENNEILAKTSLKSTSASKDLLIPSIKKGDFLLTLKGGNESNKWSNTIILFDSKFIKQQKHQKLTAVFTPQGEKVHWYFDALIPVSKLTGIDLTIFSFEKFITGFGKLFIPFAAFLFALSTMISWSYYGAVGTAFLLGEKYVWIYKTIFILLGFLGAIINIDLIINISDLFVGLLVIPNAIALLLLRKKIITIGQEYIKSHLKK